MITAIWRSSRSTAVGNPLNANVGCIHDCGFLLQPLVLAEIEIADDDHHRQFVRFAQHLFEPRDEFRTQFAALGEAGVMPRLVLRVPVVELRCSEL